MMFWLKNIKYMVLAYVLGAYISAIQLFNKIFNFFKGEQTKNHYNDDPHVHKIAIVTGCSSGIGEAIVSKLVFQGFHVICGIHQLNYKTTCNVKEALHLNLNSIESVQSFVNAIKSKYKSVDVLINCAGVMFIPYKLNGNGIEEHFATNYLGHFMLTNSLLPLLSKSKNSYVVNVISCTYAMSDLDFSIEGVNPRPKAYSPHLAYAKSKLALLLFSYKLQQKLGDKNVNVVAYDPGTVATNLYKSSWWLTNLFVKKLGMYLMRNADESAAEVVDILSNSPQRDKYFCSWKKSYDFSPDSTYDVDIQDQLWNTTLKLIDSAKTKNQ